MRLAELLGVLSLVSDLGLGLPMEHALRQCLIALRMADRLGLDEGAREATYYTGLLAWVGCHVDAYEQAKWFGDELAVKADARLVDFSNTAADVAFVLRHLAAGRPMVGRARAALGMVATGAMKDIDAIMETHWRAVDGLSASLGMNDDVRKSIEQTFERWDGRGSPHGAKGDDIRMTARLVNLADVVEVYHRAGGPEAACAVARERSGTQFDPELVELFCADAGDLLRSRATAQAASGPPARW